MSVMLTVVCNLAAVFTVPPLVSWIIAFENVKLDPVKLLIKLVLTVLLPLLVSVIKEINNVTLTLVFMGGWGVATCVCVCVFFLPFTINK